MIVKIKTDPAYEKPEVQICTAAVTPEVEKMAKTIEDALCGSLYAYKDEEIVKVPYREIVRIFTQNKNVYLTTETEQFRIKERLYELEETLDGSQFVRISNTDIVNVRKIKRLDTGIIGTIKMKLSGEQEAYVSRRYMGKIKQALGL